ncbi:MAG: class IV adenylate cyclase [Sulfolobus sp.]|nr:class IV adenylate cyclase [Sulfolobus sp.]
MIEKEVKLKVFSPSLESIKSKIMESGTKLLKVEYQEDMYFNSSWKDFRKSDEALRLRTIEISDTKTLELTYKGPKLSQTVKSREEITVTLDYKQLDNLIKILERLGFKQVINLKKKRETFLINNYYVSLDYVNDLGEFIEIEAINGTEKELQEFTKEFIKKYNIIAEQTLKSYLELILEKHVPE